MLKKTYNAKEIVKTITSGKLTIEEILSNNTMIQADVKPKFSKMTSFFITESIIDKLITYALFNEVDSENFNLYAHNASELLSQIKNSQFLEYITIEEELESSFEEEEEEEESLEEEIEEESSSSNDIIEFVEFNEINTNEMDKELKYSSNSPVRSHSKKLTKKASSKSDCIFSKLSNDTKKLHKKTFPFLDRIFEFVSNKRKRVDSILYYLKEQTSVYNELKNKDYEVNNTNTNIKTPYTTHNNNDDDILNQNSKDIKDASINIILSNANNDIINMTKNNIYPLEKENNYQYNTTRESDIDKTEIDKNKLNVNIEAKNNSNFPYSQEQTSYLKIIDKIGEIANDLLSGYFKRIFANLMSNKKDQINKYLFDYSPSTLSDIIFLARFQNHFQNCLYLIFTSQSDKKNEYQQKTLIERIIKEMTCCHMEKNIKDNNNGYINNENFSCSKDSTSNDLKNNKEFCCNKYCILINTNFISLFENLLIERNLYLRYFAYSDSNLIKLITVLYDKLIQENKKLSIINNYYMNIQVINNNNLINKSKETISNRKISFSSNTESFKRKTAMMSIDTNSDNEKVNGNSIIKLSDKNLMTNIDISSIKQNNNKVEISNDSNINSSRESNSNSALSFFKSLFFSSNKVEEKKNNFENNKISSIIESSSSSYSNNTNKNHIINNKDNNSSKNIISTLLSTHESENIEETSIDNIKNINKLVISNSKSNTQGFKTTALENDTKLLREINTDANTNSNTNEEANKDDIVIKSLLELNQVNSIDTTIRDLLFIIIKLTQNMIIDVGLSSGIQEDDDIYINNTNTSSIFSKCIEQENKIKLNCSKISKLEINNNKIDLDKCLLPVVKKDSDNGSIQNNNESNENSENNAIIIPKPYIKPRQFALKDEEIEDEDEEEEEEEDEVCSKKALYKSQPIAYSNNEPYEVLKKIFKLLISNIKDEKFEENYDRLNKDLNNIDFPTNTNNKCHFPLKFGLSNIYKLEEIILIIELFSDLNYTITVNNVIQSHMYSSNNKKIILSSDYSNNTTTNTFNSIIKEEAFQSPTKSNNFNAFNSQNRSFKRKSTLNKDKRILQFIKSGDISNEQIKAFINSEIVIDSVINDKELLKGFFNNLIFCFFKFEDHSILHKEVEYLIQFIFGDFCPKEISLAFIKDSCIFESIVKSNTTFSASKRNLANICEISTLIFLTKNKEVRKYLEGNENFCIWYKEFYEPVYEKIKSKLFEENGNINNKQKQKENCLMQQINEEDSKSDADSKDEEDDFLNQLSKLSKPNLKDTIKSCLNKVKTTRNYREDKEGQSFNVELLRKKTESFNRRSSAIMSSKNSKANNEIVVDEIPKNYYSEGSTSTKLFNNKNKEENQFMIRNKSDRLLNIEEIVNKINKEKEEIEEYNKKMNYIDKDDDNNNEIIDIVLSDNNSENNHSSENENSNSSKNNISDRSMEEDADSNRKMSNDDEEYVEDKNNLFNIFNFDNDNEEEECLNSNEEDIIENANINNEETEVKNSTCINNTIDTTVKEYNKDANVFTVTDIKGESENNIYLGEDEMDTEEIPIRSLSKKYSNAIYWKPELKINQNEINELLKEDVVEEENIKITEDEIN